MCRWTRVSTLRVVGSSKKGAPLTACEGADARLVGRGSGDEIEDIDIPIRSIQLPRDRKLEALDKERRADIDQARCRERKREQQKIKSSRFNTWIGFRRRDLKSGYTCGASTE